MPDPPAVAVRRPVMTGRGEDARKPRTVEVDCRGLQCPLPVLETEKALSRLSAGDVVRVVCTDPAAELDLKAFCARSEHRLQRVERWESHLRVWILKEPESKAT